jgi:signal transduction histidine kinase
VVLTIPAVVACVVAVLSLLVSGAALAMSTGPGWRALRWFGVAALCASLYAACAVETTLDVGIVTRAFFARLGGATASMLVASWFLYVAAARGQRLDRWERTVVGVIVVIAIAWLVPGLCRTSVIFTRTVPWLGATYTTTRPTPLGKATYVLLMGATFVLDGRAFESWRRGEQGALALFLSVSVQLIAGINDSLAASGTLDLPYLLDTGQFVVVLAVGTTIIARFVSDARALERSSIELREAQAELVRRERLAALGELSAVVAHEVRNPVSVIFNAVSTLRKKPPPADETKLIEIVNEEAERLKRVVADLLDFARPRELNIDTVSAPVLVRGAVDAAVAVIGRDEIVDVVVDDDVADFPGDEHLLRQALINLVTNALQAAERSGRVRVRASFEGRPASTVAFAIYDDGDGVSEATAAKLFTPFFTTRASGTGLGLAIVKRIAESHGGTITWEPAPERGVTFILRIPMRALAPHRGTDKL